MKKIMKEWRTFIKETDTTKIPLSEGSTVTLSQLITEHNAKNISTREYVQVLSESINNDLRWLESQSPEVLNEALGGISGTFSKIKGAVVEKVKGMLSKALSLAKSAGRKAIEFCKKIDSFISAFKKSHPTAYGLIKDLLKIISVAAFAYLVWKYGISSAHAEVAVRQVGGDVANLTGDAKAVIDVLKDTSFQQTSGIDANIANKLVDMITTNKKLDATTSELVNRVLSDAISVAKGKATMAGNPFADVFHSAVNAASDAAGQVSNAVTSVAGAVKSAPELAKNLTADDVRDAMKHLDAAHKNDPESIARVLIKVTKKIQANDGGVDLVTGAVKRILQKGL